MERCKGEIEDLVRANDSCHSMILSESLRYESNYTQTKARWASVCDEEKSKLKQTIMELQFANR